MANFLGTPRVQYFESGTAEFLTGGKLYSYEAGTLTPTVTYPTIDDADAATNPNTNPVILDARGEASVVIAGATKLILKDADDNTIWTEDDIGVSAATGDIVDTAGNELLKFVSIVNSVNYWQISNASTGTAPLLEAAGADLNVAGDITSKGTADLNLDGGVSGDVVVNATSTGDIQLKRKTLVANLDGPSSGAIALNATSTGDVQLKQNTAITGTLNVSSTIDAVGSIETDDTITAVTGAISGDLTVAGNCDFLPTGMFIWQAHTTVPAGWLHCDGSAVSRTTYAALFAAISTTYGVGDGSTTFNLPNTERSVIVGEGGTGTGELANTVGSTGGSETHTLTEAEMPAHTHDIKGDPDGGSTYVAVESGGNTRTDSTQSTGGDAAHNNMQPSLVMFGLIRYL